MTRIDAKTAEIRNPFVFCRAFRGLTNHSPKRFFTEGNQGNKSLLQFVLRTFAVFVSFCWKIPFGATPLRLRSGQATPSHRGDRYPIISSRVL
jgi:hypothetical protein